MRRLDKRSLPPKQGRELRRAIRLEWITILALTFDVIVLFVVMGQSQAMKTAWMDNLLSLVPPIVFLGAERYRHRPANRKFPYGFPRAVSLAFLIASTALAAMGAYLLIEAVVTLIQAEKVVIDDVTLFGHKMWAGWPMMVASAWSGITAAVIAHRKLPIAKKLQNRVLAADASMGKADWMVSVATIAGVVGLGFEIWWADAVAAGIISINILHDGVKHLREGFTEFLDRAPEPVDTDIEEPVVKQVERYFESLGWVKEFVVRVHERGEIFVGSVFVVPTDEENLIERIEDAIEHVERLHWRMGEFMITPVSSLDKLFTATPRYSTVTSRRTPYCAARPPH